MTTADERSALTLTARSTEDILAMVPVVLGFTPTASVVMLTFGAERTFHARIDLPARDDPAMLEQTVEALLEPATRHRVRRVALVLYGEDRLHCRRVASTLTRAFARARIEVVDALRVADGRWFPAVGRRAGVPSYGVPFDTGAHRFTAAAVLDGRVTLPSRAALAATLAAVPGAVGAVEDAVASLGPLGEGVDDERAEAEWVVELVAGHTAGTPDDVTAATVPALADLARLVRAVQVVRLRDAAWWATSGADPRAAQSFWTEVVRRTPPPLQAPPATLLGFAAWTGGHGAMAWCAVEVAERADPHYSLMTLVRRMLVDAVPPEVWDPRWHWRDLWDDEHGSLGDLGVGALGSGHGRTG